MNYLLTVLTNGRPEFLQRTLAAFAEHVQPAPTAVFVYDDGLRTPPEAFAPYGDAVVEGAAESYGMCAAHAKCWQAAAESGLEWVFHIEDDQVLLRPIWLDRLQRVLDRHRYLAQMALVRCPWGAEIPFGGYIPQSPSWYQRVGDNAGECEWIETTRNWSTSPALFRTALTREFPWPTEVNCETTIGPQIIASRPDTKFGLWGHGEPLCAHIGVDRAAGAYGY